jgi:serine/threonine-protein kinase
MELPEHVGRYDIEALIGQGPTGRVVLARDPILCRKVAIKMARADLGLEREARRTLAERFRQGAREAAPLSHPGIAPVHDAGEDEDVGPFVVTEAMSGGSLRERLATGRMIRSDVAALARALGLALAHAHRAGVTHGNVKPENVLFGPAGAKLTDFVGQASARSPSAPSHEEDRVPTSAVGYAAPETLSSGVRTPASDQFSLAATLEEALTGRPAFSGTDARATARQVQTGRSPNATSVLPELRACPHIDTIFQRALSKDPGRRFGSCEAFVLALCGSLEAAYSPILTPVSQSSIGPRAAPQWHKAAAIGGLLVIVGLVLLGQQRRGPGVSLNSVARAFEATIPHAATRHVRSPSSSPAPFPSASVRHDVSPGTAEPPDPSSRPGGE